MMIYHATAIESVRNYFISPHRMNVISNTPEEIIIQPLLKGKRAGELEDDNCVSRPHHHSFLPSIHRRLYGKTASFPIPKYK